MFVLTAAEMRAAEAAAAKLPAGEGGVPTLAMMEAAGAALAAAILERVPGGKVVVLAGPGANGGDGWVAARALHEAGRDVSVGVFGARSALQGDAAVMASFYEGEAVEASAGLIAGASAVIDALFGTGLSRPLEGPAAALVEAVNGARRLPIAPFVLSADVPSGIAADTGAVNGPAIEADMTLAFGAKKPCHLLYPAKQFCGEIILMDVRVPAQAILAQAPTAFENGPAIWAGAFPRPRFDSHKYARGAVAVLAGPPLATGAARLAARAALRAGAGAVTLYGEPEAARECAAHATAVMVRVVETPDEFARALEGGRTRAAVVGPGAGVGDRTRAMVRGVAASDASCVVDADALTSFADDPVRLFEALRPSDVLTPHAGEFARVFPDLAAMDRLPAARAAAARAGAVVVLKGGDTVVAAPDGRAAINANAPPDLATAGAGDVLAGFVAALLAQGMPSFEAACAAVWLHGACGQVEGPGLIAEDLPEALPKVLSILLRGPSAAAEARRDGDSKGQNA